MHSATDYFVQINIFPYLSTSSYCSPQHFPLSIHIQYCIKKYAIVMARRSKVGGQALSGGVLQWEVPPPGALCVTVTASSKCLGQGSISRRGDNTYAALHIKPTGSQPTRTQKHAKPRMHHYACCVGRCAPAQLFLILGYLPCPATCTCQQYITSAGQLLKWGCVASR